MPRLSKNVQFVPNVGYVAVMFDRGSRGAVSISYDPFPVWAAVALTNGVRLVPMMPVEDSDVLLAADEIDGYLGFESTGADLESQELAKAWGERVPPDDTAHVVNDDDGEDEQDDDDEDADGAVEAEQDARRMRVVSSR